MDASIRFGFAMPILPSTHQIPDWIRAKAGYWDEALLFSSGGRIIIPDMGSIQTI